MTCAFRYSISREALRPIRLARKDLVCESRATLARLDLSPRQQSTKNVTIRFFDFPPKNSASHGEVLSAVAQSGETSIEARLASVDA
jgi:hypothetical protein